MSARRPNPVFRESFLWYQFDAGRAETMRQYGEILSGLANEADAFHPRHEGPLVFGEVEAAAVDLAAVVHDLGAAAEDGDSRDPEAVKLAGRAVRWAEQLGAILGEIRAAVAVDDEADADPVSRLADPARQGVQAARDRRRVPPGSDPVESLG
ncbi:MAG: hypothetical protein ACLF0P_18205 [Thermoanaerobaculia bacterium]